MRIKTFESVISLRDLFTLIKPLIESQYEIVENSFVTDSKFLIIGVDLRNATLIIRGSVDLLTNRTYLSVNSLKSEDVLKILALYENPKQSIISIGNCLYEFIEDEEKKAFIKPFVSLDVNKNVMMNNNHDLIKIEKKIFNQILESIKVNFGYSDSLMKFPFSINIDGAWEFWEETYSNILNSILNNLKASKNSTIKTYAYYDFALTEELYQRIFDLIIAEEKEMTYSPISVITGVVPKNWNVQSQKRKEDKQKEKRVGLQKTTPIKTESEDEIRGTHYLWLCFVITNRTLKPMTIIQVLKLIQEVKRFSALLQKKRSSKYIEVIPSIIFLSLFGYDQEIGIYLRENLFREQSIIIPIFTIPPIREIWHNLRSEGILSDTENDKKKALQNMSNIYNRMLGSSSLKKSRVEDAEKEYKQLELTEKNNVEDNIIINYWAQILRIEDSNKLLDLKNNQDKIMAMVANLK